MSYKKVKGCYDIHRCANEPWKEPLLWTTIENAARSIANINSLYEIRTPVFEHTDVFLRTAGEMSDIVSKEMYTFEDKGGRSLSLRPELTAPVIRSVIENSLYQNGVDRLFYIGPCWRYDRAQKGRYRQFNQFGIELLGSFDITADIEAISTLMEFYKQVGLTNLELRINSIGDKTVRDTYSKALQEHFGPNKEKLSEDSKRRFDENPLRILDSKSPGDIELSKDAPMICDFLSEKQKDHFEKVKEALTELGIKYTIDYKLVRGLDYYCDTVFEVVANDDTAAQNTLGAGGRYNGLVKQMGGQDIPGVGFATGLERVIQNLLAQETGIEFNQGPDFFLIGLNEDCKKTLMPHLFKLRQARVKSLLFQNSYNIKKALATADKMNAAYAIIMGPEEHANNSFKLKNLSTREEATHHISKLYDVIEEI